MNIKIKLSTAAAIALLAATNASLAQTPLPHSFASITALPDRTMSLTLTGRVDSSLLPFFDIYPIEVSNDLVTWQPLTTLVGTNAATNALTFIDSKASQRSTQFYRTSTNQFVTALAKPTGPYAVGRIKRLVTDPTRTNRYNIETNSSFMVTLWYPADAQAGVLPGEYLERKLVQSVGTRYWDNPGNVSEMFSFSLPDAPLSTNGSAFPVVIYAPGYGTPRDTSAGQAEELASHGFVVATMDHSESLGTVFPDGRVLAGAYPPGVYGEANAVLILSGRVQDVNVVIGELDRMNIGDPMFSGRLNLEKIGGFGWSAGVPVILESARVDIRIKATVCLDGYLQGVVILRQVGWQTPILAMYQDAVAPASQNLFIKATADAYWCQVRGTEHVSFSDMTQSRLANVTSRTAATAIRACMLSFFNKYLKGEDNHLLDNPAESFPVIFNFLKK